LLFGHPAERDPASSSNTYFFFFFFFVIVVMDNFSKICWHCGDFLSCPPSLEE
jgi:hypothetical protein